MGDPHLAALETHHRRRELVRAARDPLAARRRGSATPGWPATAGSATSTSTAVETAAVDDETVTLGADSAVAHPHRAGGAARASASTAPDGPASRAPCPRRRLGRRSELAARRGAGRVGHRGEGRRRSARRGTPRISEPGEAARERGRPRAGFDDAARRGTSLAWHHLWDRVRRRARGRPTSTALIRAPARLPPAADGVRAHSSTSTSGIPARGLHGEAYRGHVFWDELFVFPFLNLRLPRARPRAAAATGTAGSARRARPRATAGHGARCSPGRAGSDGREETQTLHLNPRSGRWLPDNSRLQRHIELRRRLQHSGSTTRPPATSTSCRLTAPS